MPSFDIGPTRAVGATDSRLVRDAHGKAAIRPETAAPQALAAPTPVSAGDPPVDVERVAQIRKAVENGTYPIMPARIADEMIAAGFLLRVGK